MDKNCHPLDATPAKLTTHVIVTIALNAILKSESPMTLDSANASATKLTAAILPVVIEALGNARISQRMIARYYY